MKESLPNTGTEMSKSVLKQTIAKLSVIVQLCSLENTWNRRHNYLTLFHSTSLIRNFKCRIIVLPAIKPKMRWIREKNEACIFDAGGTVMKIWSYSKKATNSPSTVPVYFLQCWSYLHQAHSSDKGKYW